VTIPDRTSAAALLLSLAPPPWHVRHSRAVAEVAAWLATRAADRGIQVDRALVEAAALLHDADKALPPGDPLRRLPHGAGSAAWLARAGAAELGPAVTGHPVTRLAEPSADEWLRSATTEELLVAYADKRAGQRLEPMAARFASWARRYPDGWDEQTERDTRRRAERLERDLCDRLSIGPEAVRRSRWTGDALRRARGS
jgi:hypothetical protein